MRVRISSLVVASLFACLLLAGGCIDAVGQGLTAGVRDGLAAIVEDFITQSVGG